MSSPGTPSRPHDAAHEHVPPLDQYVHHEFEAGHAAPDQGAVDFVAVRGSEEFGELRSKFRAFAFPMTVAFIVWYFAYVLLSTFAEGFMSTPVLGHLNVGLLWGLAQFATTFLITFLYVRHANRNLDPLTRAMRQEFAQKEGKI